MSFWKLFGIATLVIIAIEGFLVYQYFWGVWSTLIDAERSGIAQIYLGTVSVIAIVFTLLYATFQFRKALAKPQLKIVVEKDSTGISINVNKALLDAGESYTRSYKLYIYNDGNQVADLYNVEFKLPGIIKPSFQTAITDLYGVQTITGSTEDGLSIIHFYSRRADEYVCYVHKLVNIGTMILEITPEIIDWLPYYFKIGYRIFGSWAAKQEGSIGVSLVVL